MARGLNEWYPEFWETPTCAWFYSNQSLEPLSIDFDGHWDVVSRFVIRIATDIKWLIWSFKYTY